MPSILVCYTPSFFSMGRFTVWTCSVVLKWIRNPACSFGWYISSLFSNLFVIIRVSNLYNQNDRLIGQQFSRLDEFSFLYIRTTIVFSNSPGMCSWLQHLLNSFTNSLLVSLSHAFLAKYCVLHQLCCFPFVVFLCLVHQLLFLAVLLNWR